MDDMEQAHSRSQQQIRDAREVKRMLTEYTNNYHAGEATFQNDAFAVIVRLDADVDHQVAVWN
jgi:hypothetical protein